MDPIEKIIRENCWRFDKGYPSTEEDFSYLKTIIESTIKEQEEEEISKDDIKKLIDSTELSPIQLKKLNSIIGKITFTAPIEQYLAQKAKESNISRGQIVKFQDLLDDLDIQKEFADYIKNPSSLDMSKPDFTSQVPGIPSDKLIDLFRLMGGTIEGTVSIGPGEILFSILFNNVKKRESKGDLDVGGQNVELKGSTKGAGAVIAKGYNRGEWSSTRRKGRFDEFVKSLGMEEDEEKEALSMLDKKVKWPTKLEVIYNYYKDNPNFSKDKFIKGIEDILSKIYNKSNWYPSGKNFNLNSYFSGDGFNSSQFSIDLAKELVDEYQQYEGFDGLLFIDKNGKLEYLSGDNLIDGIGSSIAISGPSDDVPRYVLRK
jgi:hypothetical protein